MQDSTEPIQHKRWLPGQFNDGKDMLAISITSELKRLGCPCGDSDVIVQAAPPVPEPSVAASKTQRCPPARCSLIAAAALNSAAGEGGGQSSAAAAWGCGAAPREAAAAARDGGQRRGLDSQGVAGGSADWRRRCGPSGAERGT